MSFPLKRSTRMTVEFPLPFSVRACPQRLSPGVYLVETDETLIESASFCAYRPVKTFLHLHNAEGRPGIGRVLEVSGGDLDEAISIGRLAGAAGRVGQPNAYARSVAGQDAVRPADDAGCGRRLDAR